MSYACLSPPRKLGTEGAVAGGEGIKAMEMNRKKSTSSKRMSAHVTYIRKERSMLDTNVISFVCSLFEMCVAWKLRA